ncbi:MAG: hypothetical protein IJ683_01820 [Butyrivibrio sp.]|nr:hypothetical protein [Butyrivibrio sp.]MBE5825200.1 hypothetical protein [Butyrivibrio sp.]MBR1641043.1 hypothetical protein [Butyrivibrio sp.]
MDAITRTRIFNEYEKIYVGILSNMYPAKNSTGFPERNLSVNFAKAYERISQSKGNAAYTWYEFQFGTENNLHVDAVIVNPAEQELLIIESKRYSNPTSKMKEVGEDIERIQSFLSEIEAENRNGIIRINATDYKKAYGVILADVWTETLLKGEICDSYLNGMLEPDSPKAFLNKYRDGLGIEFVPTGVNYFASNLSEIEDTKKYNLVSFMWELK